MRTAPFLSYVCLAIGLAACSHDDGIATVSDLNSVYDSDEYVHDSSVHPVPVTVRGSAFGLASQPLEALVIERLQNNDWSPHAHLTASMDGNTAKIFRFAVMLNGPENITADTLCRTASAAASPQASPTASGDLRLLAVLCRYDQVATEVSGRIANISGPSDPRFAKMVATMAHELTTPVSTDRILHRDDGNS